VTPVIGALAPDLAYALDGSWLERPLPGLPPLWWQAHSFSGFPFVGPRSGRPRLPTGPMVRPLRGRPSAAGFRDFGSLGRGPRWYVTLISAVIGAASHVLWDRLAQGPPDLASTLFGAVLGIWLIVHIGRTLLLGHVPQSVCRRECLRVVGFWASVPCLPQSPVCFSPLFASAGSAGLRPGGRTPRDCCRSGRICVAGRCRARCSPLLPWRVLGRCGCAALGQSRGR
jgi:hypothetical protein